MKDRSYTLQAMKRRFGRHLRRLQPISRFDVAYIGFKRWPKLEKRGYKWEARNLERLVVKDNPG